MKKLCNKQGFGFIELIMYVAIVAIVLSAAVVFGWNMIFGAVKSRTEQEVNYNLKFASERIIYEIRNASGINSVAATSISLANVNTALNPTVIDLSGGRIRIGQGSAGSCPTSSPCFLTSSRVNITNLVFTNMSSSGNLSQNIKFNIDMSSVNPGTRTEWNFSQSYSGAAEVRGH